MPKPPGREISIISDWGSGIKLLRIEDRKDRFFSRWTHFQFVAVNLKVFLFFRTVPGNQQNLLTVCLWKTTSQFHRFFERSRIPMRGTWQNNGLSFMAFTFEGFLFRFPSASFSEVPVLERSQARERAIGLPG